MSISVRTEALSAIAGPVLALGVSRDDILFFGTASALCMRNKSGMSSLVAGHRTDTGYMDGEKSVSSLLWTECHRI